MRFEGKGGIGPTKSIIRPRTKCTPLESNLCVRFAPEFILFTTLYKHMIVAVYVRVSTTEQNLERQLDSTHDYAKSELDVGLNEIQTFRDKSTGTDTQRSGYQDMMEQVQEEEIGHVVVHEISRLARSLRDLERTVTRVTDNGASVHFVRDGLSFGDGKEQPMHRLQMQMLGAFAEWQARVKQMNTKEGIAARQAEDDYHHGRPPLGFEKDDGKLIEGKNYDRVCAVLDMVAKEELSKRQAANELNTSRTTISRAIERDSLYAI